MSEEDLSQPSHLKSVETRAGNSTDYIEAIESVVMEMKSEITRLKVDRTRNMQELASLKSELAESRQEGVRLRSALELVSRKPHEGDCIYTDKSDEGCYLCRDAENKNWKKVYEILNATPNTKAYAEERQVIEGLIEAVRHLKDPDMTSGNIVGVIAALARLEEVRKA